MEASKTEDRGDSINPTNKSPEDNTKVSNGGVQIPREKSVSNDANNKTLAVGIAPSWKGPQPDHSSSAVNGDPFKEDQKKSGHRSTLSGNATTFLPGGTAPISFLNHGSTADGPVIVSSAMGIADSSTMEDQAKAPVSQQPIGTRGDKISPTRPKGHFTTDVGPDAKVPGGHYIKIMGMCKQTIAETLEMICSQLGWRWKVRGKHAVEAYDSKLLDLYVSFDDLRDAEEARCQVQVIDTNWNVVYISQVEYASSQANAKSGTKDITAYHDGQVMFRAQYAGHDCDFVASYERLFRVIEEYALRFGSLVAFEQTDDARHMAFRAEYHKISVAKHVLIKIAFEDPPILDDGWLVWTEKLPDYSAQVAAASHPAVHNTRMTDVATFTPHRNKHHGGMAQYASPTGRTAWRIDENGAEVPTQPLKQLPKCHSVQAGASMTPYHRDSVPVVPYTPGNQNGGDNDPRSASWAPTTGPIQPRYQTPGTKPHMDNVDITAMPSYCNLAKIMMGLDVRTTVMLRNLPNELDYLQVKEILDRVTRGKYDFSYLRIDFGNNCNVGYGFVNFIDPVHIVEFIQYWVGSPWYPSVPYSPKRGPRIAEVSYATVQGLECLIEKFRNSSVMDEYQGFRPKLWYTEETAPKKDMVCTEMPFPRPNNLSKHQRSRDNATQIGLYASGKKSQNKHTGSNRRSLYDRGTTAQMQEDAYYYQNQMTVTPTHGNYGANGYAAGYGEGNYVHSPMPMHQPPPMQPVFFDMNGFPFAGNGYNPGHAFNQDNGFNQGNGFNQSHSYIPGNAAMGGNGFQTWAPPPGYVSGFNPSQPGYPTIPPPPAAAFSYSASPMRYPAPSPNGNGFRAESNFNGQNYGNGNIATAGHAGPKAKASVLPKIYEDDKPRTLEASLRQVAINKAEIRAEEEAEKAAAEQALQMGGAVQSPAGGFTGTGGTQSVPKGGAATNGGHRFHSHS